MGTVTERRFVTDWGKIHEAEFGEMFSPWHIEETKRDIGHDPSKEELMTHYCKSGRADRFQRGHRDLPDFQKVILVSPEEYCTNASVSSVAA